MDRSADHSHEEAHQQTHQTQSTIPPYLSTHFSNLVSHHSPNNLRQQNKKIEDEILILDEKLTFGPGAEQVS